MSGSGIALLAILGMGGASWWATYEGKHSKADFSRFLSSFSTGKKTETKVSKPRDIIADKAQPPRTQAKAAPGKRDGKDDVSRSAEIRSPSPRPSAPVGSNSFPPRPSSSRNVAALAAVKPPAPLSKAPVAKSGETKAAPKGIPVGRAAPHTTPSVIYARERIIIRQRAWDKAAGVGTVEKGREMRSYGKTGKWHRVVVPSTNMIGWVHEDMLAASQPGLFMTGSIFRTPVNPEIAAPNPPPMPVKSKQ
ncbi:hypothetical protein DUT91_12530 [Phyllobacterium salinisoli]|uniref:SH3 domain-containing protein n=2 Tax=Phyllobacterium salinisoli TaxID=1899321 RepID=A0A368K186_9HYPH|nr:hypothetical protein DUT91_12530 [Phyllobacterium salinisoli]